MAESIDELRKICQQTDRFPWPERRISIYITKLFLKTSISANQVTLLDFIFGFIGAIFLFFGDPLYALIGALFLELFSIFDFVDGEVARYRKSRTTFSEFFQDLAHPLVEPLTYLALGFGLYRTLGDTFVFVIAFSGVLATYLNQHINLLRERLLPNFDYVRAYRIMKDKFEKHMGLGSFLTNLIVFFIQDHGIVLMLLICAAVDWLNLVLLSYNIYSPLLNINLKFLFLLFYGIVLQILWIITAVTSVRLLKSEDEKMLVFIAR